MADQDEYRIKVSLDPSSATAGGDAIIAKQAQVKAQLQEATAAAQTWGVSLEEAQAALAQIRTEDFSAKVVALKNAMREAATDQTESAESAEEQTERLQRALNEHQAKVMQNVFYIHRLAEGFKDISMGGRQASQGLMDVSESLQYMLPPQWALLVVGAQVVGMLATMVTRHKEAAGAAREHADAEKEAASEIASAHETFTQEYLSALDQVLKAQERVNKASSDELGIIREKQRLAGEQAKLDEDAAVEKLRQQYLIDQQKPDLTDEQRKQMRDRYESGVKDIKGQTTVNTAYAAVQAKAEDYAAQHNAAQKLVDRRAVNQKMIDDAMATQQSARATIEGFGYKPNEKGEFVDQGDQNAIARLHQAVADAQTNFDYAKQEHVVTSPAGSQLLVPVDPAKVEQSRRDLEVAQANLNTILSAQQNYNVGTEAQNKVGPTIEADSDAIKKAAEGLQTTLAEWLQAQQGVRQARIDTMQEKVQDQTDQRTQQNDEDQEKLREARDNELEASRLGLQAALDSAAESDKPAIQKKLAGLEDQEAINRQNDALHIPLTIPGTPAPPVPTVTSQPQGPGSDAIVITTTPAVPHGPISGLPTPQELLDNSIKDRMAAQIGANDAKTGGVIKKEEAGIGESELRGQLETATQAVHDAKAALKAAEDAHPKLAKGINGLTDLAQRNADATAALAGATQSNIEALESRVSAAEAAVQKLRGQISSLKNNFLN